MNFESNINNNRQPIKNNTYTAPVKDTATGQVSKLSVGEKFSGEITDISKGTVTIRLENGQSMQARLQENYRFNVGEKITFEVKSNSGSVVEIRPITPGQESINATAMKALEMAGLPVNDKTLELLKSLMSQQMPIDKATLSKMYKMVLSNSNADPSTLVEMTKLNIPITKENVAQFQNYKNFNHQISSQIDMLSQELPKLLAELSKEGNVNTDEFHAKLLSIITPDAVDVQDEHNSNIKIIIDGGAGAENEEVGSNIANGKNMVDINNGLSSSDKAQQTGILNANISEDILKTSDNSGKSHVIIDENGSVVNLDSKENMLSEKNLLGNNTQNIKLNDVLNKDMLNELTSSLKNISSFKGTLFGDSTLSMLSEGELTVKEFFDTVKSFVNSGENLHSLMQNKVYHRLIGMQFENNMLISPNEVADKEQVEQYYSRLKQMTNDAESLMQMVGKEASIPAKQMSGLSENIDFMNQLNQMFNYIQLPLKLAGRAAHGDLYVFTKKKNLLEKEGKISALLHLDMTNLGNMDVYVELEKKVVSASFRMENENGLRFLENNVEKLKKRLIERGYSPTAEFLIQNNKPDFVEDFLQHEQSRQNAPMQRFSFDVKA